MNAIDMTPLIHNPRRFELQALAQFSPLPMT